MTLMPEWISSIGTAIAALATIPLWIVSWRAANAARRSADAADLSARAAIWIELPLITGELSNLIHRTEPVPVDAPYGGQVIYDIPDQYAGLTTLELHNYGRSVARLELVRAGYHIGPSLPPQPIYSREYPCDQNMVVPPGEGEMIDLAFTVEVHPDQRPALMNNEIAIWFYAEVIFRDYLDDLRKSGLAWKYSQLGGGGAYHFLPITGEAPAFRYRL